MSYRKRRDVLKGTGALAVGSVTGFAGCLGGGGGSGSGNGSGGSGSSGESSSLTIGHLAALSGPFAAIGEPSQRGADLAAQQINNSDRNIEVDIIHGDTENSADTAINRARELVQQEDVDVLIGFGSSSVAQAVSQFANSQNILCVATIAQTPTITGGDCNRVTFRTASNLVQNTNGLGRTTREQLDGTRVAGILPDYSFGQQTWEVFQHQLQNSNKEVVNETFPAFGQGDYQNEIQETLNANPDIVYTSMWAGDLITFIQQASGFNFFDQVREFVAGSGAIIDVSRSLGADMKEMVAVERYYYEYPDTDRNNQFVEAWRNQYNSIPVNVGQETYAGIYGVVEAANKAGNTNIDDIISSFEGLEWQVPEGTKRMRAADHQVIDENIWTGRVGPVEGLDFYGFPSMNPVPGNEVTPEPNCNL